MCEKYQAEKLRLNSNWDHREKAIGTHSEPRWRLAMWLAGLVLISCTLLVSPVVAKDTAPDPTKTCAESTKNYHDHSCSLWKSAEKCPKNSSNRKCFKWYALFDEGECHYLLVPTDPVIGVEDPKRNKQNYFKFAWDAAQRGDWNIKHHTRTSLGLAINPATQRSQHQLHIHIGRLKHDMREALQQKSIRHQGIWYTKTISGKKCSVKFIEQKHNNDFPFPFSEVAKEFSMYYSGIIVAGNYYNETKGFYIVRFNDKFVEGMLNYHCPK